MKLYKLTDTCAKTNGNTQWGPGMTHTATGEGNKLCTDGVIHAYRDPRLGVLMDPIQGKFGPTARCWEAEGVVVADDGTKVGCKSLTTLKEIPLPDIPTEKRVEFAIRCAQQVYDRPYWTAWANDWLSGKDRTAKAAYAAATKAAYSPILITYAAAYYAAYAAAHAAIAAAAAYAAAYIAETAICVATTKATLIETALAETFGGK